MILHRLGLINKDQRGFTLIELLVAIAITGVVIIGLSFAVFQLVAGNARNSNHTTAVRQVQAVGHWMSQDMLMAETVVTGDDEETADVTEVLTVIWTEYKSWKTEPNDEVPPIQQVFSLIIKHKVIYTLNDGELERNEYRTPTIREDRPIIYSLHNTFRVAQYIVLDEFNIFPSGGGQYTLMVKATVGGFQPASETREYEIIPRPAT